MSKTSKIDTLQRLFQVDGRGDSYAAAGHGRRLPTEASPRLVAPGVQGMQEGYEQAREYLKSILYTSEEVESLILGNSPHGEKYDPDLGWVHADNRRKHGVDDSIVTYRYDRSGARRPIMYADKPYRIHTYGDSFTLCSQVSDGETWQEVLAAHLIEPVRNYGIGGYSVYQAYLRMKREESRTPAQYIIFNIYHDDHYRNLHSWRTIRHGQTAETRGGVWGPPMPFVKVNPATGEFIEYPNPCPTPESLSQLQNIDWVYETFKDDFVLRIALARRNMKAGAPEESYRDITQLAREQGLQLKINSPRKPCQGAGCALHKGGNFCQHAARRTRGEFCGEAREKSALRSLLCWRTVLEGFAKRISLRPAVCRFSREETSTLR